MRKKYPDMPWENIEKFESSPLTTHLRRNCVGESPSIDNVFNLLSSGYTESIKISIFRHGNPWCYEGYQIRIIPISSDPNLFLYFQKYHYEHDGLSMYRYTDEYQISVRIKSIEDIEEHLAEITQIHNRLWLRKKYPDILSKDPEFEQNIPSPILTSMFERSQLPKHRY